MKPETKALLIKYGVCFAIAALITFGVFAVKGFFTDSVSVNIQILSDGFFISGMLFLFAAGMMFVSGEGGLIAMGFIFRSVVQIFVPGGRRHHVPYAEYREQKMSVIRKPKDHSILVTGLIFFTTGVIFTIIWYARFYNVPG